MFVINEPKDKYDRSQSYRMLFPLCSKEELDKFVKDDSDSQGQENMDWAALE